VVAIAALTIGIGVTAGTAAAAAATPAPTSTTIVTNSLTSGGYSPMGGGSLDWWW
jgi:hypothetical protein